METYRTQSSKILEQAYTEKLSKQSEAIFRNRSQTIQSEKHRHCYSLCYG